MDNKAYLDQIAVKGKVKSSGVIFTPMLIKIIAAAVVALITMIIVGAVINGSNSKVTQSYERAYSRITNLVNDESPLKLYTEKLRDSDLRAYAQSLIASLTTTNTTLGGIAGNIGINPGSISKVVADEEAANTADLQGSFEDAVLSGTLDRVYAAKAYHQISILLSIEAEARAKTPNQQFAELLDQSTQDLSNLQVQFKKLNSKSE